MKDFAAHNLLDRPAEANVAVLAASIDASRDNCRMRECEMGNTVAEAMLSRVAASGVTIAISNGGGMRASLAAGEVTLDDIFGVLPFQNTLFTMELTGAQIIAALEQGVSRFEIRTGSFPQIAGLRFRFSPLALAGRGRVTEVNVQTRDGWAPIDPAVTYSVVVSKFMAAGGDGYSALAERRNRYDTTIDMADALAEFLSANAPYAPRMDGRIAR